MAEIRLHDLWVDREPGVPEIRLHDLWVDRTPAPGLPPEIRLHDLWVDFGLGSPVTDGGVWVWDGTKHEKHNLWIWDGTKWDYPSGEPTTTPGDPWPTLAQVGPRDDPSTYPIVGDITTTTDGQLIEKVHCTGRIIIRHSDVVVRDVYMDFGPTGGGQYWISTEGSVGNILIEHVEIDAPPLANGIRSIAMNLPGVNSGGVTLKNIYVHGVGSGPRFYNNCHIQDSIVEANFYAGSTSHRSGIGNNGGSSCSIKRCRLECKGEQSSAAISLYGDFAVCVNHVFEDNLLICNDGAISYGGSVAGKPFPQATGVVYRRNRYSFVPPFWAPLYDALIDFTPGVNGCVAEDNVWATAVTLQDGRVKQAGDPIDI